MEAALLCFGGAVDLAGVVDALAVGVEDFEGAVVGFLGAVVCLFAVEEVLVFFGGSLGILFFCSGIIIMIMIMITLVQCVWCTGERFLIFLWLVKLHGDLESIFFCLHAWPCFPRKWQCGVATT